MYKRLAYGGKFSFSFLRLRNRDKLPQYNTIADAVQLIQQSRRILILTGAGISGSYPPVYEKLLKPYRYQASHVAFPTSAHAMGCTRH